MRTLKVYAFKNFQACNPALLTAAAGAARYTPITDLLTSGGLLPWLPSPVSPMFQAPAAGSCQSARSVASF